jgi:hypothetical protein
LFLEHTSENGGFVKVKAKSDFAGKRLASTDGSDLLKKAFQAARVQVDLDMAVSAAVTAESQVDPRVKFQKKAQLAKEHDAVKAALEIFDGVITETKILDDEKVQPIKKGPEVNL